MLPAIAAWGPSLMQLLPTGLDDFVEAGGHGHLPYGEKRLGSVGRAHFVPGDQRGESVSEDALRSVVGDRLAAYKVPERVVFLEALPRTGTGKFDRHRLEQQIAADLARARKRRIRA